MLNEYIQYAKNFGHAEIAVRPVCLTLVFVDFNKAPEISAWNEDKFIKQLVQNLVIIWNGVCLFRTPRGTHKGMKLGARKKIGSPKTAKDVALRFQGKPYRYYERVAWAVFGPKTPLFIRNILLSDHIRHYSKPLASLLVYCWWKTCTPTPRMRDGSAHTSLIPSIIKACYILLMSFRKIIFRRFVFLF